MISKSKKLRVRAVWDNSGEMPPYITEGGLCIFTDCIHLEGSSSPSEVEERVFDFFRGLSENSTGATIIAAIKLYPSVCGIERAEKPRAIIRGIFRAAVYGNISLMCQNINSDKDLEAFLSLTSSIFCELEAEKREFNGYISKGIMVETPLAALSAEFKGIDFICVNLDRIIPLILGHSMTKRKDMRNTNILTSLTDALSELFGDLKCKISLFTSNFTTGSFVYELAETLSAEELLVPINVIDTEKNYDNKQKQNICQ